jgi:hypothetical protein
MSVTTSATQKAPVCPEWCVADHDGEYLEHYHFGDERCIDNVACGVDGETSAVVVLVRVDGERTGRAGVSVFTDGLLTPAQARRMAALLMNAADKVDGIPSVDGGFARRMREQGN